MKAKLIKLSICQCGFGLLKDEIKLGTVYNLDMAKTDLATMLCGGCGRVTRHIPVVMAWRDGGERTTSSYLPRELFFATKVKARAVATLRSKKRSTRYGP